MKPCKPYLKSNPYSRSLASCVFTLLSLSLMAGAAAQPSQTGTIGTVRFGNSCQAGVQDAFDSAVAMLHSFEFEESRTAFAGIADADTGCAMAHWGIAMTYYHPLWAPPSAPEFAAGVSAAEQARELAGRATAREHQYIEAIAEFFDTDGSPHRERARRYEAAMARVHESNPMDREAEIFYALARLSNADPTDKSYAVSRRVGPALERLFAEMPDHPGLAHYIIHSYDYPELADQAVDAADRYLEIARTLPHALHMSGHIYTQLGLWERAIEANKLSVDAAVEQAAKLGMGEGTQNEMHSLDYLVYAHLQLGESDKALVVVERVASYQNLNLNNGVVSFNASAIPVRYAMERQDWEAAARIPLLDQDRIEVWNDQNLNAQALRHWARIIGAAKTGNIVLAQAELVALEAIAESMQDEQRVWGRNTPEVFRLQATAWLALANDEEDRAESLLRAAADLEGRTDKSSISPGRVLPAHEQLGDLLLALDRPAEAFRAYEESLMHAPGRLNSILGAMRSAEAAGEVVSAREYASKLPASLLTNGKLP